MISRVAGPLFEHATGGLSARMGLLYLGDQGRWAGSIRSGAASAVIGR